LASAASFAYCGPAKVHIFTPYFGTFEAVLHPIEAGVGSKDAEKNSAFYQLGSLSWP
jgi:hypothetical protein